MAVDKLINRKFKSLPLGAVKPSGYLKTQMLLQAKNLTGNMELYDEFGSNSGWLGGSGESWERGPYYVRGLVALAYALNDNGFIKRAAKWIDYAVDNQKDNGDFGSSEILKKEIYFKSRHTNTEQWWARMPMLMAIRDYYEAELNLGNEDKRILPFFDKYFRFQKKYIKLFPLSSWAKYRGADNIEIVLWYRDKCLEKGMCSDEVKWLAELAKTLLRQSFDWAESFEKTNTREHVVNTTQGFKYPFYKYLLTGDKRYLESLKKGLERIGADHGRIDNLPNADEGAKDNQATNGTETCAVVEGMLSFELGGEITGESYLYDLLESYAYNNLPNCFDYEISAYNYFQLENSVLMSHGQHGFCNDHGDSNALGISGFECCFSNMHMGYPKFVQNMWVTEGDSLVLAAYGANEMETQINGKRIAFEEVTDYPYRDTVKLVYKGEKANLKLKLRIPSWSQETHIYVNGEEKRLNVCGSYALIDREFNPLDVIEIVFRSEIKVRDFHLNTMYVKKGAVIYCMPVAEDWRQITDFDYRGIKYDGKESTKNWEIYPKEPWNFTFRKNTEMKYEENDKYSSPLPASPQNIPCKISLKMEQAKNWNLCGNKAATIAAAKTDGKEYEKYLIPTAFTRLKISVFPKISDKEVADTDRDIKTIEKIKNSLGKVPEFKTSMTRGYGLAQLSFKAKHSPNYSYRIIWGEQSGVYTDISALFSENPYSYGGDPYGARIAKDKIAVSLEDDKTYYLRISCFFKGKIYEISNEVRFN